MTLLTVFRSTKRKLDAPELPESKAARRLTFSQALPVPAEPEEPPSSASDASPGAPQPPRAAVRVDPLVKVRNPACG